MMVQSALIGRDRCTLSPGEKRSPPIAYRRRWAGLFDARKGGCLQRSWKAVRLCLDLQ